jgi:hypothetical protein
MPRYGDPGRQGLGHASLSFSRHQHLQPRQGPSSVAGANVLAAPPGMSHRSLKSDGAD